MGYYIECVQNTNKAAQILASLPGRQVSQEEARKFIGTDKAVICVVSNGLFEAAAYCYNEREFNDFTMPEDKRPKFWLVIDDKAKVETITKFKERS
jgi:hypothetical protein